MFKLTILGCGTSTGVPVIQCSCAVCQSKNKKNHRFRTAAWIEINGKHLLIDTSTDLRQQALRAKIPRVDAVLYTHPHADHINGIDELRSFNFIQRQEIAVYGNAWTCRELKKKFSYIFNRTSSPCEGGGIPQLKLYRISSKKSELSILGEKIIPLSLQHGSNECLGYRIQSLAYVTDCHQIPIKTMHRLKNLSVLILNCVRYAPHSTHLNYDQAMNFIQQLNPKKTFLTHLSHDFDFLEVSKKLPKKVFLAYDGLVIHV